MAARPVSLSAYARLIKSNPNFRRLWLAQVVSEIGDWFYSIAVYSLLLELTGSAKAVAIAVVLQVLPQFFIAPMAGVVNDRVSRRKVMIFADLARAAIVLGMLAVKTADMVPLVYGLLLLQTFMWGFFEPGRTATLPNLMRTEDDLLVGNALSSTTWSFNLMAGAALGGLVAAAFGRDAVFVINSLTFLASAAFLRGMKVIEPHVERQPGFRPRDLADFSPVIEGIRYVSGNVRLLATLLVKSGLGLLGAHWVILPIYGERIFPLQIGDIDPQRAGMLGMSVLMGSRGVGALVGPLIGGYWAGSRRSRLRLGILAGFIAITLGYSGLGLASRIGWAIAAVILAHAGGSVIWVFSTTLLHLQADDRFRGRVFAADFGFLVVTMSIMSYAAGVALDWGISVRTIAIVSGSVALFPAALWGILALPLWKE
ncbi:MAG: MFS transporter [Bryobacteraceae bacterium]|nr:MFS transporter [Bryobacteraceae bacterium]